MTAKNNKPYNLLVKAFGDCIRESTRGYGWGGVMFSDITPLIDTWDSLSHRGKIKAVKDIRWNRYPLISYTATSSKRYGSAICELIRVIRNRGHDKDLSVLRNHSVGIFAIYTLNAETAKNRISMAKRLKASKDVRLRTRCVRILPVKYMSDFMSDPHYSVRNMAITRIGIENCYTSFIPKDITCPAAPDSWGMGWYEAWKYAKAIDLSEKKEIKHLVSQLKDLTSEELGDWENLAYKDRIVEALLRKLSVDDILYCMDYISHSSTARSIIADKLSNPGA